MQCLSSVAHWNESEQPLRFGPAGELRCNCRQLAIEQQRLQVLEAEAELRRLRDRVRKTVSRWSAAVGVESQDSPVIDRPIKRSRLQRPTGPTEPQVIEVEWNITPEQLAEHLCYWRHSSALSCVGLTDCLKELTPRSEEPPASKRALTLVWWDMEHQLEEATSTWHGRPAEAAASDRQVVTVAIGDIVPLFVWEVDLLRLRPQTRQLCRQMLECEIMEYQKRCGTAEECVLQYLRDNPLFTTSYGAQACRCEGYMRNAASQQRFKQLRQQQLEERAHAAARVTGRENQGATPAVLPSAPSGLDVMVAAAVTVIPSGATSHWPIPPATRRRLDASLVTLATQGSISESESEEPMMEDETMSR
jgi:hypothetical protein